MPTAITEKIRVDADQDTAFAFMADFTNLPIWDPNISASTMVKGDPQNPIALGSAWKVTGKYAGQTKIIEFEIKELDAPRHIKLVGQGDGFTSTDVIDFAADGTGALVTYNAQIDTSAPDIIETMLVPAFKLIGIRAANQIRKSLSADAVAARSA